MMDEFFTELGKLMLGVTVSWVIIMVVTASTKAWWDYMNGVKNE